MCDCVLQEQLGVSVHDLDGELPELIASEWTVGLAVHVKPTEAGTISASVAVALPEVAACARLHWLSEDTCHHTVAAGLATGQMHVDPEENPSGCALTPNPPHTQAHVLTAARRRTKRCSMGG